MSFRRATEPMPKTRSAYDPSYRTTRPMTASQAPFHYAYNGPPRTMSPYPSYYAQAPMTAMEAPFDYSRRVPYTTAYSSYPYEYIPQTSSNMGLENLLPKHWHEGSYVPNQLKGTVRAMGAGVSAASAIAAGAAIESMAHNYLSKY